MSHGSTSTPSPATPASKPSRWTARIGLLIVGTILVSCFGLLIAASNAAQ